MRPSPLKKSLPFILVGVALAIYFSINPPRLEHVAVLALLGGLCFAADWSRDLAVALVPAGIFGYAYDSLRLFAERSYHAVIVEPIYRAEQYLFGWTGSGELGPVDFFRDHHHLAIDLLAGMLYSTHVPSILIFGVYLWWRSWKGEEVSATADKMAPKAGRRDKQQARVHRFMWGYLIFNLLGFVVWVVFPVAPPWYVEHYGFAAPGEAIPGDPAALARVDAFVGYPHFSSIYREATYVFGAMPSLHVAPAFWIAFWARLRPIKWAASLYAAMMSFFAVYLGHHYIIDVLAGAALAWAVYLALAHTRLGELPDRAAARIKEALDDLLEPRARQEEATSEA